MKQRLTWIFRLLLLTGLTGLVVIPGSAGCEERATPPPVVRQEKLSVLATVYPLADIARQVGGEYVTVEWIAESGQPLPQDEAPLELRTRADQNDFVLSAGETWASAGYDDPHNVQRIVRADLMPSADADTRAHGLVWLDPAVARDLASELAKRYAQQRLRQQHYFRTRADAFIAELDALTNSYAESLTTKPPRKALVVGPQWDRLLARFGIQPLRPLDPRANASELSASQLRQLKQTAAENRLTTLFVSADTPPAVVRDLEDRTDLTVLTLDVLGSSASGGRNTYLEMTRYNLDQLNRGASAAER